ncbi:MAG: hypothetical protein M2R45_03456 [Verrucomicrobia subdivision 3 bacterium]|nr:hypothetical protein [Limisphaerales bacterium]MCS1415727.1 hypothetical protein [Limisphaerales bacterium]
MLFEGTFKSEPEPALCRVDGLSQGAHAWFYLRTLLPPRQLTRVVAKKVATMPGANPTRKFEGLESLHVDSKKQESASAALMNVCAVIGVFLSAFGDSWDGFVLDVGANG